MHHPLRLFALAAAFCASAAFALPAEAAPSRSTDSDTEDDAVITLEVVTDVIRGDTNSFCRVRVQVAGTLVPLAAGDTVELFVRESDFFGDDSLWTTSFEVSAEEIGSQNVDRSFDCNSQFIDEDEDRLSIFASADVTKAGCGLFCFNDTPTTPNISVTVFDDDDLEANNSSGDASDLGDGATINDRICRDADWYRVTTTEAASIAIDIEFSHAEGNLEVTLFDGDANALETANSSDDDESLNRGGLVAGSYFIRVSPVDGDDFNFYDIDVRLAEGCLCDPGEQEMKPCGRCGQQIRTCLQTCVWGEFSGCQGEGGQCDPGDVETGTCGNCGSRVRSCDTSCRWRPWEDCSGEGDCRPEAVDFDNDDCDPGQQRERTCDAECSWGEWGDCFECNDGDEGDCYTGPAGTEGIGVCQAGRRSCMNGAWTECAGEMLPAEEGCGDSFDNDCDGETDEGCAPPETPLGAACARDADCGGATGALCIRATNANPDAYPGGYCILTPCPGAGCGDTGLCVSLPEGRQCMKRCATAGDCRAGYVCEDRDGSGTACVPECPDASMCPGNGGGMGSACTGDADCNPGFACSNSVCTATCASTDQCGANEACVDGFCRIPGPSVPRKSGGGGCAQASAGAWAAWALLGALLWRRRRRA